MKFSTYIGGFTILNSSAGEFGTRRIIIFRPSVEPIPIDVNDRSDVASENNLFFPSQSLNTYEFVRGIDNNVCNGWGDVYDDVSCVVGVKFISRLTAKTKTKKTPTKLLLIFHLKIKVNPRLRL